MKKRQKSPIASEAPRLQGGASRKGSFVCIVPLDPAYKAGLAGHVPVRDLCFRENKRERRGIYFCPRISSFAKARGGGIAPFFVLVLWVIWIL